jgi:hypothetical protein
MNPKPSARAAILRRFLSIRILPEYSDEEYSISEVIKTTIAMKASQRLISDSDKGKFILSTLDYAI